MLLTRLAVVILTVITLTEANDSLEEAYHAIRKRAERLGSSPVVYYSRPYIYGVGQPENIGYGYQKNLVPETMSYHPEPVNYADLAREEFDEKDSNALEKLLLDYIEETKGPHQRFSDRINSDKRSVFREREPESSPKALDEQEYPQPSPFRERGKLRQREARLRGLVQNEDDANPRGPFALPGPSRIDSQDDEDYLTAMNLLWQKYQNEQDPEELSDEDLEDVLEYLGAAAIRDASKKRPLDNEFPPGYDFVSLPKRKSLSAHHKRNYEKPFDERYSYRGIQKRFPIAKRSPSNYLGQSDHKKKSEAKMDASTAAELNNIFDSSSNLSTALAAGDKISSPNVNNTASPDVKNTAGDNGQKEQALVDAQVEKPVNVKKKSINWSKYFGYDRKKKSSDWLVDQYLRQYGLPSSEKRWADPEQESPRDVDSKMGAMEDMIVDKAVKFAGAHEGIKDAREIQEVKDKVMAQLAAAYSLEKMRRALGEFKASIAAQKLTAPTSHSNPSPKTSATHDSKANEAHYEKVATSPVPKMDKKQDIDLTNSYQINEEGINDDECPIIDDITERCNKVAYRTRSDMFLQVCGYHQLCSACGVGKIISQKECDAAFINETVDLCDGDHACLRFARLNLHLLNNFPGSELDCNESYNPCISKIISRVVKSGR